MMQYILKSDIPNYEDYPHTYWWLQQLIQSWRNALGDLQPVAYEGYWLKKYEDFKELENTHRLVSSSFRSPINFVIGTLWMIWFITTVFNQVIMLNFMIAIVQESYDRVMIKKI